MKSRVITVSAVSAGLVAVNLALGVYVEFVDVLALIATSVFVILPLYVKSYIGAFLSYLAGGVLGLIFGWFNFYSIIFPSYFAFFGLYPIINCFLKEKKVKKYISILIGLIWCIAAFYGIYFYYTIVIGLDINDLPQYLSWIYNYIIYAVGVLGLVFYFAYDKFITVIRTLTDKYLGKIIK